MKNFFSQIFNKIIKFDEYTNEYLKISNNIEIPSLAYTNWGMHFAHLKDFNSAIEKLETAMLMSNQNPKPCISLGIIYAKQKEYQKAEHVLKEALRRDSQNSSVYSILSGIYVAEDKFEQAEAAIKKALILSPKDPEIYLNYGVLYAKTKKKHKAIEMLKKSKNLNPVNAHVYFLLGVMFFETDLITEAFNEFKQLEKLNSGYKNLNYYIALCYKKEKNYTAVLEYAQRALEEDEDNPSVYILLAQNYLLMHKIDEALNVYKNGIARNINDLEFDISYGVMLYNAQKYNEAREKLYSALEKEPDNANILHKIGNCYYKEHNYDEAQKMYSEALKKYPENTAVLSDIGMIYYEKKDYETALQYFLDVIKKSKDKSYLYFYAANSYYKLKRYKKSSEYYEKTLEYYPDHIEALINYAVCMLEANNTKEALRKIRHAYQINRNSEKVLLVYALSDVRAGIYRDALEKADKLLEKNPAHKTAKIIKAQVLININRPSDAIMLLNSQDEQAKNQPISVYLFYLAYKLLVEENYSNYNESMLKFYSEKLDKLGTDETCKNNIDLYIK